MTALSFMFVGFGILAVSAAGLISVIVTEEAYNWWNYRR